MNKLEILQATYDQAAAYVRACVQELELAREVAITAFKQLDEALRQAIDKEQP